MPTKSKISKSLSGISGEYFAAAELSRRGFIASITLRKSKGVDILAASQIDYKSVGIQVKTYQGYKKSWVVTKKVEENYNENLFYIFVNLNGTEDMPTFHIVPSKAVAEHCKKYHQEWLETPGRNGQKHNDNRMRKFSDPEDKYLDRWDLLGLK